MILLVEIGFFYVLVFVFSYVFLIFGVRGDVLEGSNSEKIVFWIGCGFMLVLEVFVRLDGFNI